MSAHRLFHAPHAALRQRRAAEAVASHPPDAQVLVIAPSLEAGSRVLRLAVEGRPAAFGLQRATPGELAARLAAEPLARAGRAQVAPVVLEAVCARMVHERREANALGRYAPVGDRPGLPRALARTFGELGLARVAPDDPALPSDLGRLFAAYRRALADGGLADRASVLEAAVARVQDPRPHPLLDLPVVLFDVALASALDGALVEALAARGPVTAWVPSGDATAIRRLEGALGVRAASAAAHAPTRASERLAAQLFAGAVEDSAPIDDSVELFSAPGESRECVEIARRVMGAARRGVPFDRMAVLAHAPDRYRAHLLEALRRAGIPAHFSRGTKRPDPAGRALLALLECRAERLSARAFAEYLSLGVVPPPTETGAPPAADGDVPWLAPVDEWVAVPAAADEEAFDEAEDEDDEGADGPVVAGTLRAPWRWERLLVDAAVIGGAGRWRRRLDGLARALEGKLAGLDDPEDPRRRGLERARRDLAHLRAFALPLLDELEALPREATWGEWATHLARLAERAIRRPARVLAVLRELGPMGPIGPVGLTEVQLVLAHRLTEMTSPPGAAPAGKLYVASTEEARGLTFHTVFVPGLAERVFPRKVIEDPVALDAVRARVSPELATTEARVERERLALRLAVGAAEARVVLSYPRLDTERGRPRVPSFYGLEVLRAIEGTLPSLSQLARRAERAGAARMAWPAPDAPEEAIDAAEYDLAVLHEVLEAPDPRAVHGAAQYLVQANPHLARALRRRHARWGPKWTSADGLVNPSEAARAALAAHALDRRAYAATALEQLAACPYRFYLRTVLGLSPREEPEALEALDPLTRGRLIHEIQAALLAGLRDRGWLPLTESREASARALLDEVTEEVARDWEESLAPAIERVWRDAVADVRSDLREWLLRMAERPDWVPEAFELAFGLPERPGRDPGSVDAPVTLPEGLTLRGSIDLVEARDGRLRATDHKTGRAGGRFAIVDGGRVLQPLLYARVLEELRPDHTVAGGRLYYCTARGRFEERFVPLDDEARATVRRLVEVVGGLLERGFFPAAPASDECAHCDYRPVCGPVEERRAARKKPIASYGLLKKLRKSP
ncbi:MAG TPA: PD-(D/E)XK nuclease family protein [Sandaracinaceae bacterium LLY-WYZ-13_1]|nr:PD-(D/E)XK nuclease family protein [Sandaracinaceae bacterium LLY-WYZ-13_1]